jgi:uncharacterized protein (TIGR01777 family)
VGAYRLRGAERSHPRLPAAYRRGAGAERRHSGENAPAFKLGLGGPIGNGRQYLAWIHIDDMVNGILWLLDNDLRGPFNMVSPYPVRNEQFAHALGHALHRPAILRVPATAIRLLMGEASVLVLGGQRALPKRLEAAGFAFRWYELEEALGDVVR